MAKFGNAFDGLTLKDLLSPDGFTMDIGDEYREEDEEEFSYSPDVHLTNEEVLNVLNMEDLQDENEEKEDAPVMPCGISFEKLKSKMTSIYGDGKVMKLIKQRGVGEVVPMDAQVTVNYVGYFEYRDEPFDSTYSRGRPDKLRLGKGKLISGLEIGIATMQKHEVAMFIIHPDLAFGQFGCMPRIPPNEEVMFIVYLLDFLDNGSADTYENLSIEERKSFSNILKYVNDMLNTAKDSFKRQKIKQAIREYKRAIKWLESAELQNEEEEQEAKILLSKAYGNLAICFNIQEMPRLACMACNRVPIPNAKTHFNRGRALLKMGEYSRAIQELQIAYKMKPNNKEIFKEIQLANEKQRKYLEIEKGLWSNCLKTPKEDKGASEFERAAREICETFARDDKLLRQPLPEGLTPEESKYVCEQAAALGLSVTKHQRYGKTIMYLQKPKY